MIDIAAIIFFGNAFVAMLIVTGSHLVVSYYSAFMTVNCGSGMTTMPAMTRRLSLSLLPASSTFEATVNDIRGHIRFEFTMQNHRDLG